MSNDKQTRKESKIDKGFLVERKNIFEGRTEVNTKKAKFPDWDILPPEKFINLRKKKLL